MHTRRARTDGEVDLGEHEVQRLVHELEDVAFVNLVGRDGLGHFRPVEVGALDLGGNQETLRLATEEEHSGVGRAAGVQEVQVREQLGRAGGFGQREAARMAGFDDIDCGDGGPFNAEPPPAILEQVRCELEKLARYH